MELIRARAPGPECVDVAQAQHVVALHREVKQHGDGRGRRAGGADEGEHGDAEVTIDLLFAPVYYRLPLGRETLDERFAAASVRHLITGLRRSITLSAR